MGTNENDIFFGSFAEKNLASMTESELVEFAALLDANDPDLFLWATGAKPVPPQHDGGVMRRLRAHILDQASH